MESENSEKLLGQYPACPVGSPGVIMAHPGSVGQGWAMRVTNKLPVMSYAACGVARVM